MKRKSISILVVLVMLLSIVSQVAASESDSYIKEAEVILENNKGLLKSDLLKVGQHGKL